jgi:hypothetical protein
MTEHDGITHDVRSREDEYFRRKDRELIEKMRQATAANQARQALEESSGLHDPELLQELESLGFTPGTMALLPLVPIVQVAWAERGVSEEEQNLIIRLARERGIAPGSAADHQLAIWLQQRPSEDVFARAARLIRAMLDSPDAGPRNVRVEDLLQHCEEIAAASGGVLGFGRISAEERALLAQIASALKGK